MSNPDVPLDLDRLFHEMLDRSEAQKKLQELNKTLGPLRAKVADLEKQEVELLAEIDRREATIRRWAKQI